MERLDHWQWNLLESHVPVLAFTITRSTKKNKSRPEEWMSEIPRVIVFLGCGQSRQENIIRSENDIRPLNLDVSREITLRPRQRSRFRYADSNNGKTVRKMLTHTSTYQRPNGALEPAGAIPARPISLSLSPKALRQALSTSKLIGFDWRSRRIDLKDSKEIDPSLV